MENLNKLIVCCGSFLWFVDKYVIIMGRYVLFRPHKVRMPARGKCTVRCTRVPVQ